ncbi:hypothetical protein FC678_16895 [Peribacillus simplex]|uniref:Lipoprotein n=1 Tax=Peribacillus simplex TaxID=1478 RepID=A0A9X8ZFD1_9BACI|nr:hypothetical protein [Peribacillus simplex]TKH09561.1 hypothetical protein FC678_16895 [Peribacillus simplex]
MKKSLLLAAGVISIGLLGACMQEEKPEEKVKGTASAEIHKPSTVSEPEEVSEDKVLESGEPDFSEDFENTVSREEAITPEMKAMVKDQFEFFSNLSLHTKICQEK